MSGTGNGRAPVLGGAFESKQAIDLDAFASRYGGVSVSTLRPGTPLFSQGEPATCMFHMLSGQAQATVVSKLGKEAIIGMVEAGDFCGEGCLIGERTRIATVTCIVDSTVARLERSSIVRAVQQDPLFAEFFLVYELSRAVRLRENLISQLFDSCERRLARTLLVLANYGKEGVEPVISNLDQEALAQMIGTTRSRVNYFMNKFRKLGYIDYNGHIEVHGSLLSVVDQDPRVAAGGDS